MRQTIGVQRNFSSIYSFIQFLKTEKSDFEVQTTGYTTTIKDKKSDFKYLFADGILKKNVFSIYANIKKDVLNSGVVIDSISPYDIDYFSVNNFFKSKRIIKADEIINLDIRSAYLTVLYNTGFITMETFAKVSKIDKLSRLRAVGMLATNKLIIQYEKGSVISQETKNDEDTRNVFFYLCYKTDQFLKEVAKLAGDSFLFYWVDGIYLLKNAPIQKLESLFIENKFQFKKDLIKKPVLKKEGNHLFFSYICENKNKVFRVPLNDDGNKRAIKNYIKNEACLLEKTTS